MDPKFVFSLCFDNTHVAAFFFFFRSKKQYRIKLNWFIVGLLDFITNFIIVIHNDYIYDLWLASESEFLL